MKSTFSYSIFLSLTPFNSTLCLCCTLTTYPKVTSVQSANKYGHPSTSVPSRPSSVWRRRSTIRILDNCATHPKRSPRSTLKLQCLQSCLLNQPLTLSFTNSTEYFDATFQNFTTFSQHVLARYVDINGPDTTSSVELTLSVIKEGMHLSANEFARAILEICTQLFSVVFRVFRITPPGLPKTAGTTATVEELVAELLSFSTFLDMGYVDFFVAVGLALMFISFMVIFSKRKFSRFDRLRTGALFAVGFTLCMLALMDLNARNRKNPGYNFLLSPWILPTMMLSLGIAVFIHHLPF